MTKAEVSLPKEIAEHVADYAEALRPAQPDLAARDVNAAVQALAEGFGAIGNTTKEQATRNKKNHLTQRQRPKQYSGWFLFSSFAA